MSPSIHILPEQLANQIAAGEVVERPASVVKELMENAIDAGATELFIDIEHGGKRLVKVADNGCGMAKEDLFLALERHATSKITSAADLFALHSLGFRGEALPSIASVSRLRLTSRPADREHGWQLYAEGGAVRQAGATAATIGTVVEVRDLFFNTPGRRKFLRSDETEFGHLAEVVTRLALARPDIHVRLNHNGRTHLEAYRHRHLEERAASLLGRTLAKEMVAMEAESAGVMLTGLLGVPGLTRSNASHIYAYVNGRFVRDRLVQHAILEGYRTLLEKRRYPVAVLFLDLPPAQVDVNVHPTKHEVRFRERQQVHDFVQNAVRGRLMEESAAGSLVAVLPLAPGATRPAAGHPVAPDCTGPEGTSAAASLRIQEALASYAAQGLPGADLVPSRASLKGEAFSWHDGKVQAPPSLPADWRLIGQYLNSYLVCQAGSDLLLIDQHAAHERIGFEKLRRQMAANGIERQSLLFPVVIELDHREASVVAESLADLARLGFELEPFGGRSYTVTAVPQLLASADTERLIRDVAEELAEVGRSGGLDAAVEQVLIRMACHSMVRANQPLTRPEMEALVAELAAADFGSRCPHGRPVLRRMNRDEIERLFHRL